MARCGCNAASATTCDAIVLCVAANLGAGLRYDTVSGLLAVRISADAGNTASFGSDNGIYVPGDGAPPDPAAGRKTVAGLPARVFGATQGGGGAMVPFSSPQSIEYAVANRMDLVSLHTFALADDIAVNRWGNVPADNLDIRTDNPSTIDSGLISSLTLPSLSVDAGVRITPTGRNSGAPAEVLTPDGGWFGFYAWPFSPITLAQALHQLAARSVAFVVPFAAQIAAEFERALSTSIDAVIQTGAQEWTIMGVSGYVDNGAGTTIPSNINDFVGDVIAAGITPAVDLFDDSPGGFAVTPAAVLASGADWVRLRYTGESDGTPYARIQEFIDAGLQVLVQTTNRHVDTTTFYAMGARGVLADSPVYARGARGEAGDLDYRKTVVIPGLVTRTQMEGALTQRTNSGFGLGDAGWARQSADGRNFSAGFGRIGGVGLRLTSQLLGELCPYQTTPTHRLRVRFRMDPTQVGFPTGNAPRLGLFVAAPDDRDISHVYTGDPNQFAAGTNGYWAFVNVGVSDQGRITLAKLNDGAYTVLDSSGVLSSIVIGEWIYMSVTLSPTTVNLAVGHVSDVDDVIYTVTDSDHRGPYLYYTWEDDWVEPITNPGFAHGYSAYQNFATTSPMWEDLT